METIKKVKMTAKQIRKKGILAKLLEQSIKILLMKECKKIRNIRIDIISSSTEIIQGKIQKIKIIAEDINYKGLLFDEFILESNNLEIRFKIFNKELDFINNPIIKFKILLSQNSLKTILFSNKWSWIENLISKELLNKRNLEDISIRNDNLLMKVSEKNIIINQEEMINIKSEAGKIYLENKIQNRTIQIPIENKIFIKSAVIENNLINIFADSSINL